MGRPKRATQTAEQLAAAAKEITSGGEKILACVVAMKTYDFPAISPGNYGQFVRACQYIANYAHAVDTEIRNLRLARGDIGSPIETSGSEEKPRRKKSK